MLEFIRKNKAWLFSGVGVRVPLIIGTFIYNRYKEIDPETTAKSLNNALTIFFLILLVVISLRIYLSLNRKSFFKYAKYKLKESMHFLIDEPAIELPGNIKYDCFELYKNNETKIRNQCEHHEKIIKLLNHFVCTNQGNYVQFSYMAGELHKPIKEELRKEHPNLDSLKNHCNTISAALFNYCEQIFDENHDLIIKYFEARSGILPRCCVKGYREGFIFDYYRKMRLYHNTVPFNQNTGCCHVAEQGTYYLCNNIPAAIKNEEYENPRINSARVREILRSKNNFDSDSEWYSCWRSIKKQESKEEKRPPASSCYKYTLIIPMTLIRNKLTKPFADHFRIPNQQHPGEKSRAIYGLLCFDHKDTDDFIEDVDVAIGYLFSDIMSLYLIDYMKYTEYSNSYRNAIELTKKEV